MDAPVVNAANLAELNKRILEIKRKIVLKGEISAMLEQFFNEHQRNTRVNLNF